MMWADGRKKIDIHDHKQDTHILYHSGWRKINQKKRKETKKQQHLGVRIYGYIVDLYYSGKWWKWAAIHLNWTAEHSSSLNMECSNKGFPWVKESNREMWEREREISLCLEAVITIGYANHFFLIRLLFDFIVLLCAHVKCVHSMVVLHHILSIICCIRQGKKWKRC